MNVWPEFPRPLPDYDDPFIPTGRRIRIPFTFCPICDDRGVVFDEYGEPVDFCYCPKGEQVKEANS
jgi:hypothetical protein